MKISVITVTYNSAATIEHTIRSVAEQTYPGKEHIIVDGGSTDGTLEIIEKFRIHISKLVSEKDEGLYDAVNKGIRLADGEVIAILHSDDFFAGPSVLADYAAEFTRHGCDAVYADLEYVRRDNTDQVVRRWKSGPFNRDSFLLGWMPPHPTFFARQTLYAQFGLFNTSLRSAADYELMLRFLYRHGITPGYLPKVTIKMRTGGTSNATLRNRIRANKEDRRAWKLNGLRPKFYTLWLKPLRKLGQFLG